MRQVGIIGAGAWGTALAQVCARAGLDVRLWAREQQVVESIQATGTNALFLAGIPLDPRIRATLQARDLAASEIIFAAPPAQHFRSTLSLFAEVVLPGVPVVVCAKGIEAVSLKLMTQVLAETVPSARPAVLSGPSFAEEVARDLPTAVTLAAEEEVLAAQIAQAIASARFRPYVSSDMIGAQAGGSVKNVLAIACGVVEGRGLGASARAALITRGFAELSRLAVALGGSAETVVGLCGLGDLVLTCGSLQSRNMSLGVALGQGVSLHRALEARRSVAEGVASAPAVVGLARRLGVEAPICQAVCDILAGEVGIDPAITTLLTRPLKAEI